MGNPVFSMLNSNFLHGTVAVTVDTLIPALRLYVDKAGYVPIDNQDQNTGRPMTGIGDVRETVSTDSTGNENSKKIYVSKENKTPTNRVFKGNGKLVVLGKSDKGSNKVRNML